MYESNRMNTDIAIVGMACKFPGAETIDQFWLNLKYGVESISNFTDEDLKKAGIPEQRSKLPNYVKRGGVLNEIEYFDAAFFGYGPGEAALIDPQQRLFLQTSWECLENAGHDPYTYPDRIGVYAGSSLSTYLMFNIIPSLSNIDPVGEFQAMISNDKDYLSTRVAYKLNLGGPSVTVQTACSTSLVAIHMACQSILNGECEMALAGGSSVTVPHRGGYLFQQGGVLSPDGHCRAFDKNSRGTVKGNGVGTVLLKPLTDALEDKNHIYAVIKGTSINNDGSRKVGYTAPSVDGQSEVIDEALLVPQINPESIGYVETHGTGTPLGDPIEMAALSNVYNKYTNKKNFCAIGALKTNVGHMDAAAGVGGLIKSSLCLYNKALVPSLNFNEPNEEIDFQEGPFFVNTQYQKWEKPVDSLRRAAVSSFGIGGTNAHAVIEEAPVREDSKSIKETHLLLISAKTPSALDKMEINLSEYIKNHPQTPIHNIAFTLMTGRHHFQHRRYIVVSDTKQLLSEIAQEKISKISKVSKDKTYSNNERISSQIVFMFSGQGSQYIQMGADLCRNIPAFRQSVDECCQLLKTQMDIDIKSIIYPESKINEETASLINQTEYTQSAIFIIEYCLAKLWMSWGIIPSAMIGHSIGEYVAATISGVMSLEEALRLVAIRGKVMSKCPGRGAMLSINAGEQDVKQYLNDEIQLAAINAEDVCVVSGVVEAISQLEEELKNKGISVRRLHTSHAFHSKLMRPIVEMFQTELMKIKFNKPQISYISNVSGKWIESDECMSPTYWINHLLSPVNFYQGIRTLLESEFKLFLEVGPGQVLNSLTKRILKDEDCEVLYSIRHPKEKINDYQFILNILGNIWSSGVSFNVNTLFSDDDCYLVPLPTYPFETKRYWIDRPTEVETEEYVEQYMEQYADSTYMSQSDDDSYNSDDSDDSEEDQSEMDIVNTVMSVWKEFLGVSDFNPEDNYFALGGDSLIASRIAAKLNEIYPVDLKISQLLENQTCSSIAAVIESLMVEKINNMSEEEAISLL